MKNHSKFVHTVLLAVVLLILLPVIKAESFGKYKVDEPAKLIMSCANSTWLNITKIYTNQNIYINSETATTKLGGDYNYTFLNTSEITTYYVRYHCDLNGIDSGSIASDFLVNNMGESFNLFDIILVVAFLVLATIVFLIGNTFKPEQYVIKTSFYIISLMFGLLAINSARIIASSSANLNLMSIVGLTLSVVIFLFMLLYLFIYWTIGTIRSVKQKKNSRWEI